MSFHALQNVISHFGCTGRPPQVEQLDKTPPSLVSKGTPSTVDILQEGQHVIYITSRDLQVSDPDSPVQELEFAIVRPPHFGHLENAHTGRCP